MGGLERLTWSYSGTMTIPAFSRARAAPARIAGCESVKLAVSSRETFSAKSPTG
jgi:hypothetical protein